MPRGTKRITHTLIPTVLLCMLVFVPALTSGQETEHHHTYGPMTVLGWEGSPEGKAYSEFNHHLAGWFVILIGLSEIPLRAPVKWVGWVHFLLPVGMLGAGSYLMVWSEHDAWPIGHRTFTETFFTGDWETLEHKIYAMLLLAVGSIELMRRIGRLRHTAWAIPLPTFAVVGGMLLFLHSHGPHPAAHAIALHHMAMGTLAIAAGACKFVGANARHLPHLSQSTAQNRTGWAFAWAGFILLIGLQLLVYTE